MIDSFKPLELNVTSITRNSITATLDVTNFSNDFGVINDYAVWVRQVDIENLEQLPAKPGKTAISWTTVSLEKTR